MTDKDDNQIIKEKLIFKEFLINQRYMIDVSKYELKCDDYYITIIYENNLDKNNIKYTLQLNYKQNTIYNTYIYVFLIVSTVFVLLYLVNSKKINSNKIHIMFLKLAFPIFILYMILIPMLAGHDETYHWHRVYEISEGTIIPDIKYDYSGSYLPIGIEMNLKDDASNKYKDILNDLNLKIDNDNRKFISEGSIGVYAPIQFLPQVIAVFIARNFTDYTYIIAYMGRLFNTVVCLIILTLAIKKIPYGKRILMLFCLNPIAIECFTTLSGDGLTISLSYLLIAYVLSLRESKNKINYKDVIKLLVLTFCLSTCKIVYVLLVFCLLLIPKDKYKDNKEYLRTLLLVLLIGIITNFIWLIIISKVSYGSSPFAIPSKNLELLLENPFNFIKYFIYSFERYGGKIIAEIYSSSLLMFEVIQNNTMISILLFLSSIYISKNDEKSKVAFQKKDKIIFSFIFLCLLIGIFLSVYVFFCIYQSKEIYAIQGRYFLPIIPLIYIIFNNNSQLQSLDKVNHLLLVVCLIINFMALMEIFIKFI